MSAPARRQRRGGGAKRPRGAAAAQSRSDEKPETCSGPVTRPLPSLAQASQSTVVEPSTPPPRKAAATDDAAPAAAAAAPAGGRVRGRWVHVSRVGAVGGPTKTGHCPTQPCQPVILAPLPGLRLRTERPSGPGGRSIGLEA